MMLGHQRATTGYPAGKQSSKSASAAASTAPTTNLSLPPALTANALTTLCILPISSDSTLTWQRYDFEEINKDSINSSETREILHEALLHLRMAEIKAFGSDATLSLVQSTLWTVQRETPGFNLEGQNHSTNTITKIWLFNLQGKENVAESSKAASSEERQQAAICKGRIEHILSQSKARREQGSLKLQNFYTPLGSKLDDDPALLVPIPEHSQMLSQFIEALEEHFLTGWISSSDVHQEEQRQGVKSDRTPDFHTVPLKRDLKRSQEKEEGEKDEEEEGAIRDSTSSSSLSDIGLQYWPKSSRRFNRKVIRFGKDVLFRPIPDFNTLFEKDYFRDRQAVCFTLRCFIDEKGNVFMETRSKNTYGMERIEDGDFDHRQALMAPNGMQATLIERFKNLSWSEKADNHGDREGEKQALESKQTLLEMLQARSIDVEELDEDWMVCETEQRRRILWPTKLCFLLPSEGEKVKVKAGLRSLPVFLNPLLDIAERVKGLVKESLGMRNVKGNGDAMILNDDDHQREGDEKEEEEGETDGDAGGQEEGGEEEAMKGKSEETEIDSAAIPSKTVQEESTETVGSFARISSVSQEGEKPRITSKEEEEMDLWGTFGFGLQDNDRKDLSRPQSAAGLEEGGFGLITEDDFDFFDEAAQGVRSFDEMDLDIGQQGLSTLRGDTTFQSHDTENESDLAMSHSAFLDPPSLPGFTPGSLSGTSENDTKALGGLNAKTPRTPFSPSQDLNDAHISIEGEGNSIIQDSRHFHHQQQHISDNHMNSHILEPGQGGDNEAAKGEKQTLSPQNREHLMSKYEQGKFALPQSTIGKRGEAEEGSESGIRSERELYPRNRLRHRIQSIGTSSNGRNALFRKIKLLRGEDDISDMEGTVDGTVSDRSSLIDEDSDDEMTTASEDTNEEEKFCLKDRCGLLQAAIESVEQACSPLKKDVSTATAAADALTEIEVFDDTMENAKIAKFIKRLTCNTQIRLCACPRLEKEGTIVRSLASELFVPFGNVPEDNTLGALMFSREPMTRTQEVHIKLLESPKIMVGCQGAIASMEPTALHYWEKLGLSAVSGPKNVATMALHCGCLPTSWQREMLDWISTLSDTYRRHGLGQLILADDALLALGESHHTSICQILVETSKNAEQWTDTIDSLLSRMHSHLCKGEFVVIYAVGIQIQPEFIYILSKLETNLREVAETRWGIAPDLINIRGIQWETVSISMRALAGGSTISKLAMSLYDSLDVPLQSHYNRKDHLPSLPTTTIGVIHPSFTVAPIHHLARSKIRFQLQWRAESFNMTDTGLLLHVAYHVAEKAGEVTFMTIMDEKAQGYYVDGWRRRGDMQAELQHIWKQIQMYSARARILWRIIICKRGQMKLEEVRIWSFIIKQPSDFLRSIDITLTCLDQVTPMTIILPRQSRTDTVEVQGSGAKKMAKETDDKTAHYIDTKQADYAIYPPFRITMCQESRDDIGLLPLQSSATISVPNQYNGSVAGPTSEKDKAWSRTAPRHYWIHILQVHKGVHCDYAETISLQDRTDIVTKSFHQLTFIGRERFMLDDNLPWHISILAIAARARKLF